MPITTRQLSWIARLAMAAGAGAIAPFAFSPYEFWPVMLVSIGLLYLLIDKQSVRPAMWLGLVYGLGFYGAGVSWVYVSINQFGSAPPALALLLTAMFVLLLASLFFVPLTVLFSRLSHRCSSWQKVLLFVGLWVLGEWFRSWFLTGFPWLYAGYSLIDTPFAGLAPVAGVYSLSLLAALTGVLIASFIAQGSSGQHAIGQYLILAVVIIFALVAVALDGRSWTERSSTEPLTFAAVQGNISQDLKWDPGHLDETIDTYLELSESYWDKDLMFWPENAVPTFIQNIPGLIQLIEYKASANDTAFILGMPWSQGDSYYNALVGLGSAEGTYLKQKLVPFGEYVPFESLIRGLIDFFNLPMSSFSRGEDNQSGLKIRGEPVASYICYEVVYPDFAVQQAIDKGILLTVSNDTWFGQSIGPTQHFQMVRMRSLETGRYQLRVTNDGITALINPMGDVIASIPRYQTGVLEGEIPVMQGDTPFMRFGSWPMLIAAGLMVGLSFTRRRGLFLRRSHSRL